MKTLIQIVTVFVAIYLITEGSALAQPAPAPTPQENPQAEVVAQSLQEAQERVKEAQKQIEEAGVQQTKIDQMMKNLSSSINIGTWLPQGNSQSVLVIPISEMKDEDLVAIVEDMTVMARIINKQLGQERSEQAFFHRDRYFDFIGHMFGSRMSEVIYLQGYGALFLKKVDFPLAPTPTVQEEAKEEPKEHTDELWKETRQELYEPQEGRRGIDDRSEEKYDAKKVENLKATLIESLKHATNIRGLKPDESVILAVTGGGDSSKVSIIGVSAGKRAGTRETRERSKISQSLVLPGVPSDLGFSSPKVLVIRAKKSDIDAFAKGKLDFDKFRQKVQIFTQ